MNFARLNHILIPSTLEARERLRKRWLIKGLRPIAWFYGTLSDEGRSMTLLVIFVGTAAIEISRTQVYVLWAVLVGLMLASLVVRRSYALKSVQLEAHAPNRMSVGAEVAFQLTMRNGREASHLAIRLRGPFLPWDGKWSGPTPRAPELKAGSVWTGEVRARFIERGPHHIEAFTACALLPFGLAVGPSVSSRGCRFTVVPCIAPIATLRLRDGESQHRGGAKQSLSRGDAMEILGVRPYRRGDALRDLHPKTWARTGIPHVRQYQQETFTRIAVILDNDANGSREAGFEAALSLCAGVIAKLAQGDSLVEALVIGSTVNTFAAKTSTGCLDHALDLLAHAKTSDAFAGEAMLDILAPLLRTISTIVVITESTDPSRLELVTRLKERQLSVKLLRVHDDSGPAFLARRREMLAARSDDECVVLATRINAAEPLNL